MGNRSTMQPATCENTLPLFYAADADVFSVALHEPPGGTGGVPEALVQDIWAAQRFHAFAATTTEGEAVQVLDPGRLNTDAGPDFRGAHVRIGNQLWIGDVEVHLSSAIWNTHRHGSDPHYNSVVLHVVLDADGETGRLCREDGSVLPELALSGILQAPVRQLLHRFFRERPAGTLPCRDTWRRLTNGRREEWLEQLGWERLLEKQSRFRSALQQDRAPEDLLYELVFSALGYARNSQSMSELARRLPLRRLRAVHGELAVEALLFGVSGLLPEVKGLLQADRASVDYVMKLREEFERLRGTYELVPMARTAWTFFRLRPNNFPTVRIAQAAALLRSDPPGLLRAGPIERLFEALTRRNSLHALRREFAAEPSAFWNDHVQMDRPSHVASARIGKQRIDALLMNVVAPLLLTFAPENGSPLTAEFILGLMRKMPAERDEVTRSLSTGDWKPRNALQSQGMHRLSRDWCLPGRCLSCEIGTRALAGLS